MKKSILAGILGTLLLLVFYFSLVSLLSGWGLAWSQFTRYWYFILLLAVGFGFQVGMYVYLRRHLVTKMSGKVLAVSGTTSAGTMAACCAHYLVNILPILGVSGLVSFVSQYQVELFWFGLAVNLLGINYIYRQIKKVDRHD